MTEKNYTISFQNVICIGFNYPGKYKIICINNKPTNYLVNENGFIISLNYKRTYKSHVLTEYIKPNGYHTVTLHVDKKEYKLYVHRLVAGAFLNKNNNQTQVNHINTSNKRNKYDNSVKNLEWVTANENVQHAKNNGLIPSGTEHYNYKYDDKTVRRICELLIENKLTMHQIADKTNVDYKFVVNIKNGKIRTNISQAYNISDYNVIESKNKGDNYNNRNHYLSFTLDKLDEIGQLFQDGNKNNRQISKITGVHYDTICKLRKRRIKNNEINRIMNKYSW